MGRSARRSNLVTLDDHRKLWRVAVRLCTNQHCLRWWIDVFPDGVEAVPCHHCGVGTTSLAREVDERLDDDMRQAGAQRELGPSDGSGEGPEDEDPDDPPRSA